MWLLSQVMHPIEDEITLPKVVVDPWTVLGIEIVGGLISLFYFALLIWMLVHHVRSNSEPRLWFFIMLFAQPFGVIAYVIIEYLPSQEFPTPAFLRRWTRSRELVRLESAAVQIGNPHQFIQWGDALRELGYLDRAKVAYERALQKEPQNIQALWGSALIATSQKRYDDVKTFTQQVLDKEPQYKFGDVSLARARALCELKDFDAARVHLEQHIKRWRHPESLYLLAKICADQGDTEIARNHLTGLILDVDGSPQAIGRKFIRWKRMARRLLRQLPV